MQLLHKTTKAASKHNIGVKLAQTNLVSVHFRTNTVLQVSRFDGSIQY